MIFLVPTNLAQTAIPVPSYVPRIYYLCDILIKRYIIGGIGRKDFVRLKQTYLRNILGKEHARPTIDMAIDIGVLECDYSYSPGNYAMGYRLTKKYRKGWNAVEVEDQRIDRAITLWRKTRPMRLGKEVHKRQYTNLLDLSVKIPAKYRTTLETHKDKNGNPNKRHLSAVQMIENGDIRFHPDKYGRVHTNLTGLWKSTRKYVRAQGKKLNQIDIPCSQAVFLYLAYLESLAKTRQVGFEIAEDSLYCATSKHSIGYDGSFVTTTPLPLDVQMFQYRLEKGNFFEDLATKTEALTSPKNANSDTGHFDRDKFKKRFYKMLFDKIRKRDPLWLAMVEHYPTLATFIEETKSPGQEFAWFSNRTHKRLRGPRIDSTGLPIKPPSKDAYYLKDASYSILAKMLQRAESRYITSVCETIMDTMPGVWWATLHDSILFQAGGTTGRAIKKAMKNGFKQVGLDIPLSIERFDK